MALDELEARTLPGHRGDRRTDAARIRAGGLRRGARELSSILRDVDVPDVQLTVEIVTMSRSAIVHASALPAPSRSPPRSPRRRPGHWVWRPASRSRRAGRPPPPGCATSVRRARQPAGRERRRTIIPAWPLPGVAWPWPLCHRDPGRRMRVGRQRHARFDEHPVAAGSHDRRDHTRALRRLGCADHPRPRSRGRAADPAAVSVVRARSAALRRGDVQGAARYFAPSEFINGPDASGRVPIIPIRSLAEAAAVNASLPCGARFISADQRGAYAMRSFASLRGRGPAEAAAPAPARWRARIS
jgi:hypothetical protein